VAAAAAAAAIQAGTFAVQSLPAALPTADATRVMSQFKHDMVVPLCVH
jgi:hypothetical protein